MRILSSLTTLAIFSSSIYATAVAVDLGAADSFAVLAGSTVTNTGITAIHGDVGVWPGTAITGLLPGIITGGTLHAGDATAHQAQTDLAVAYAMAAGQTCEVNLTGQDLGGLTLTPGVYCFASSAQLTGVLTLNGQGSAASVFVFQVGSALTTASASSTLLINNALGANVFWQVGSSATLGTTTALTGSLMALASITLNTGATIECGRALARNGAVTLDTNAVSFDVAGCRPGTTGTAIPEPGMLALLVPGLLAGLWKAQRGKR